MASGRIAIASSDNVRRSLTRRSGPEPLAKSLAMAETGESTNSLLGQTALWCDLYPMGEGNR
jgi:hypothetical protein